MSVATREKLMACNVCGVPLADDETVAFPCQECAAHETGSWCVSCWYEHECGEPPCSIRPDDRLWLAASPVKDGARGVT